MKTILYYAVDWKGKSIYEEMKNLKTIFPDYSDQIDNMMTYPIWKIKSKYNNYEQETCKHFNKPLSIHNVLITANNPNQSLNLHVTCKGRSLSPKASGKGSCIAAYLETMDEATYNSKW